MNKLNVYFQLSLADFRERTRRSSFFVTMLGVLFFAYLVVTGKYTVQFGEFRTIYDATWAGHLMAVCSSIMMTLVGFYLVRGTIRRDQRTEVGQIIAATPISKTEYLISKLISNTVVLAFMTAVLAMVGFVTLLFRNEAASVDPFAFIQPFLMISLPAIIFVSSVTVFFDTVHWLRGSAGNIIYLFAAEFCIVFGMLNVPLLDLGGIWLFTDSVRSVAAAAFPGERIGLIMGFVAFDPAMQVEEFKTFAWDGIDWNVGRLLLRLFWLGVAGAVTAAAIPLFDRFDPSRSRQKLKRKKHRKSPAVLETPVSTVASKVAYADIRVPQASFSLIRMVAAELRLALKGYRWFWYAVALGLVIAQAAAPFDIARQFLVPASMVWPLVIWSSMGTRDTQFGTSSLLFSSPDPVGRQFPALWLSGVTISLASVAIAAVRALVAGQMDYAATLLTAALFVPTVALTFGTLSRTRRLFEVIYLIFWYVGSVEHLAAVDLLGTTDDAIVSGKLIVLGSVTVALLVIAFAARRIQIVTD